jgi:hypothetical protein
MSEENKTNEPITEPADSKLLPPREVMSLLTDPSSGLGSLGMGGLPGADSVAPSGATDPTAGTGDAASQTAGHAAQLASTQQGSESPTVSDQPQTLSAESTETSSSST